MAKQSYRILMIYSHPVQYVSPLLMRMAKHPNVSLHVAYCTMGGARPAYDPDFATEVAWDIPLLEGYDWSEIPNIGTGSESFFGLCNPGIWTLIRRGNFDAVFCLTGYLRATFWIAWLSSRLRKSAFLFGTDANSLVPRNSASWKVMLKRIFWPHLFALADQIVVPSSSTLGLVRSLGIADERITLTPYCVDNDWWIERSAQVDRNKVRSDWKVGTYAKVVLFCAKLQPWKRPGDVLEAFAAAGFSRTQAVLVFAGDGPLRQWLHERALELGIAEQVRFLGFVNQSGLPAVYTGADIMVLPSEYEPFGLVVNEASCCGCPVAASDRVGASTDLIAPVNPEFIFPCGDIPALTALLRSALSDPIKLASRGQQALRRVQTWSMQENISGSLQAVELALSRIRSKGAQQ